jgi:WD40 repeat protein
MQFAKHWAATLDDYVIDLAWSPDGVTLAAASAAGGITLYDAVAGTVKHVLPGHGNGANCLAWSPDGSLLATGGQDGKVKLWKPADGALQHELSLGSAWVEHLAWRPGGELLFAAVGRKLVALKPDGSTAHTFADAPKTISALAWRPDGAVCAAACFGHVVVWDATTFTAQKEFPYGNAILALCWSPDGRWLVAGCHDNAVHLWIPAEDVELQMSGYETKLKELAFSSDSRWLATGGGRDACIWDCAGAGPEGREPMLLPHAARVCALAFQNQHGLLASAAAGGEFCLWSPTRKNPLVAEVKMPASATKFAWRPNDTLLAVGTDKGALYVFKAD